MLTFGEECLRPSSKMAAMKELADRSGNLLACDPSKKMHSNINLYFMARFAFLDVSHLEINNRSTTSCRTIDGGIHTDDTPSILYHIT